MEPAPATNVPVTEPLPESVRPEARVKPPRLFSPDTSKTALLATVMEPLTVPAEPLPSIANAKVPALMVVLLGVFVAVKVSVPPPFLVSAPVFKTPVL